MIAPTPCDTAALAWLPATHTDAEVHNPMLAYAFGDALHILHLGAVRVKPRTVDERPTTGLRVQENMLGVAPAASCAIAMDSQAAFIGHYDTDLALVRYAISQLHGMAAARPAGFYAEQAVAHDDCLAKQGVCACPGYRVRRRLCCMGRSSFDSSRPITSMCRH